MRTFYCIILLSLLTLESYASDTARPVPANDSLFTVWNDHTGHDTIRLDALLLLIRKGFLHSAPDSARQLARLAYDFADGRGCRRHMADALHLEGVSFHLQGDFDRALATYQRTLSLHDSLGLKEGVARSHSNLGIVYRDMGSHADASWHLTRGIEIYELLGDSVGKASALENMALVFRDKGDYAQAVGLFMDGLRIKRTMGNLLGAANSLTNIGNTHYQQGDFSQALYYNQEALKLRKSVNDQVGAANSLVNIGSIYGSMGQMDSAMSSLDDALAALRQLGDRKGVVQTLHNIAELHHMMGNHRDALIRYQESMRMREDIGDRWGMMYSLSGVGKSHAAMGDHGKALIYLGQALNVAREAENAHNIRNIAEMLYHSHLAMGNFREALEMQLLHTAMRDSINSEENQREVMRQHFQYDFEKKEALLAAEQEKKDAIAQEALLRQKLVRNGFMGGFVAVLVFAGVVLMQRNRISKEKQRSEELLLNILPSEVAEELKAKGEADARLMDHVTVLFTDFKGFTAMSEVMSPKELVRDLHLCFSAFDLICEKHGIEKIKTIGDAYMAAGGLPTPNSTHATDVVKAALEMAEVVEQGKARKEAEGLPYFEIRIGIHTGPVVAGIVGVKKFQYDIWGDTVNTASRMESSGEVGRVNISRPTYEQVKDGYVCEYRGEIEVKGKGKLGMYFVQGEKVG